MNVAASSTTDLIIADKRNGVGYLGFNRPEKHNAISYEMWQGIAKVMADFEADDTVRAVVVSGGGWQGIFRWCGYIAIREAARIGGHN